MLSPQDWAQIETGIKQRTRLLNSVMADVYGPQNLLLQGLLPAALVQGHPGYLRAMQGVQPAGGVFCILLPLTWRVAPMAAGGWFRSAPRHRPALDIC